MLVPVGKKHGVGGYCKAVPVFGVEVEEDPMVFLSWVGIVCPMIDQRPHHHSIAWFVRVYLLALDEQSVSFKAESYLYDIVVMHLVDLIMGYIMMNPIKGKLRVLGDGDQRV